MTDKSKQDYRENLDTINLDETGEDLLGETRYQRFEREAREDQENQRRKQILIPATTFGAPTTGANNTILGTAARAEVHQDDVGEQLSVQQQKHSFDDNLELITQKISQLRTDTSPSLLNTYLYPQGRCMNQST